MYYPSKKDWWVALIFLPISALVVGISGLMLYLALAQGAPAEVLLAGIVTAFIGLLLLWIYFSTGSEIRPPHLIVRCGPLRWPIRLDRIADIRAQKGIAMEMGWNFALSQDKLLIRQRKANGQLALFCVAISPEDQEGFLRELAGAMAALKTDDAPPQPT